MRNLIRVGVALCTAIVLIVVSTIAATATTTYTITDLGVLGSTSTRSSYALDINNSGQVVGYALTPEGNNRAFIWDSTNGMQDLGVLGTSSNGKSYSYANGINELGQVVGYSSTPDGDRAFIWDSTNGMQDLGVLGSSSDGTSYSYANGINRKGQVVGYSSTPYSSTTQGPSTTQGNRAFLWDSTNGMQDLGVLSGNSGNRSYAYGINNKSQVVGSISDRGFIWDRTNGLQELGVLEPPSSRPLRSPTSINKFGQVVGDRVYAPQGRKTPALIWDRTNGVQALDLYGAYIHVAYDINNLGQVVGFADTDRYIPTAALWDSKTRQVTNLNFRIDRTSGWTLSSARAINDKGEIVGSGTYNSQTRAFLLQPTTVSVSKSGQLVGSLSFVVFGMKLVSWTKKRSTKYEF